jgi:DNA-binding protein H-NS
MARPKSFATMSIEALIEMRDSVTSAISEQAENLRAQLARFGGADGSGISRPLKRGRPPGKSSPLKGRRKAKVKYRDKDGNAWSGRGAQPRWMTAAIKAGAKRDDFLVGAKPAKKAAKPAKMAKRAKKAAKPAKRPAKKRIVKVAAPAPSPEA